MGEPAKLRVMIVENEHAMREILRDYLSLQEDILCVAAVSTGQEALDLIYSLSPDVLLLDLVMPSLDGFAVLEQLNACPPLRRPWVIVISSFGGTRIVKESLRLGADYYLIKPLRLEDLPARVRMLGCAEETAESLCFSLRSRIDHLLQNAGSKRENLGHLYLVDTVERIIGGGPGQYLNAIFKEVAEKRNASEDSVAEAVRRDMAFMYRQKTPFYRSLRIEDNNGKPPSPGRFLSAFVSCLQPLLCTAPKGGDE